MSNVAVLAQSLAISRVNDERKQFCDLLDVMGFFGGFAATLAGAVSVGKNSPTPSKPTRVSSKASADDVDDAFHPVALPVGMVRATKVLAHPFAVAGGRAEVGLCSLIAWRTKNLFPAPSAGDDSRSIATRCTHPALDRAINLNPPTFAAKSAKGCLAFRTSPNRIGFRHVSSLSF